MTEPIEILLVEDNPADIELTIHALRKHKLANRIEVVQDGASALDLIFARGRYSGRDSSVVPRLILLDIKLPLIDGLEVLRELKRHPQTRRIPVVVMTSSQEENDLVASYEIGVNSYIVKPVDFEQFTEAARVVGLYWLLLNQNAPVPVGGGSP